MCEGVGRQKEVVRLKGLRIPRCQAGACPGLGIVSATPRLRLAFWRPSPDKEFDAPTLPLTLHSIFLRFGSTSLVVPPYPQPIGCIVLHLTDVWAVRESVEVP